ncbi:mucin-16-like [Mustelus asterias]
MTDLIILRVIEDFSLTMIVNLLQLTDLYNKSKINARFSGCRTTSFSPANGGDTSVYAVCTFTNDSAADKVTVYHVFRDNTKNITTLGIYLLDNDSLYVNGYHESAPSPTIPPPVTTPKLQTKPLEFNVTFIITNLAPTANLQSPNSALHKSASTIIAYLMGSLFTNSNIKRTFQNCRVRSFSPANVEGTSVDAVCTFSNDSNPQEVNKVTVYHVFRDKTKSISTLGIYSLDNNSLYVNGYHESVPSTTIAPPVTTPKLPTKPFEFNVTFIITNLAPTANLQSPNSALHKSASTIIVYLLNGVFTSSKIKRTFQNCRVRSFSPANVEGTSVDAVCTFSNDSNPQEVNKVTVYHVFRDKTKSISTLGIYSLDNNSLYVNGYHESIPSTTIAPPVTSPNLQTKPFEFNVTFIITNLAPTANLQSSNSALHKSASKITAYQLNRLFTSSKIKKTFQNCRVRSFSPANVEGTSVDAVCTFSNDSSPQEVNKVTVYRVFRDKTKSISTLGTYSLDNNSLYVNGYHESIPSPSEYSFYFCIPVTFPFITVHHKEEILA